MKEQYQKIKKEFNKISILRILLTIIMIILSLYIPKLFSLIYIFIILLFIFVLSHIYTNKINKDIYETCTSIKEIPYKEYKIDINKFIEIIKNGNTQDMYIKIKDNIHYIEISKKGDCYIDFSTFSKIDDLLSYKINDEYSIKDEKNIILLMYNNNDPKNIKKVL